MELCQLRVASAFGRDFLGRINAVSPLFRRNKNKQTQSDVAVQTTAQEAAVEAASDPQLPVPETAAGAENAVQQEEQPKSAAVSQEAPSRDLEVAEDAVDSAVKSAEKSGHSGEMRNLDLPQTHGHPQEELTAGAYQAWHDLLTAQAAAEKLQKTKKTGGKYFGQIDLTHAHPTGVAQFYAHMETRLSSLIREPKAFARAKEQLAQLRELTREISEEYGYAPVSLAAGRFTWTELPDLDTSEIPQWTGETYDATGEFRLDFSQLQDSAEHSAEQSATTPNSEAVAELSQDAKSQEEPSGSENSADDAAQNMANSTTDGELPIKIAVERSVPALLRDVRVEFLPDGDAKLKLSMQATINPEVIRALRIAGIEPEHVAKLREMVQLSAGIDAPLTQLAAVARAYLPGFKLEQQNIIGCFHTPAQVVLSDLEAMSAYLHNSGIVAALAGDEKLRSKTAAPVPPGMATDRLPEVERGAGDLDPAELDIVEAVASGRSIVIDAPAGSQRIETLASIAADAAASGKSLIFVPSRASSGVALKAQLTDLGLGEMVLDFSDVENVPQQIRTGLRLRKPEFAPEKVLAEREELLQTRTQLATFLNDLHAVNPDWNLSVSELLEKLARLTAAKDAPRTRVRFSAETLALIKQTGKDEVLAVLHRADELGIFDYEVEKSAWSGSKILDREAGERAIERAHRLNQTILPAVRSQSARAAGETGLYQAQTPNQWFEQIEMFDGISHSLDYFLPQIFETSAEHLIAATATKEWRTAHEVTLSRADKRMYRRELEDLLRPGAVPADVHSELVQVEERREIWKRYTKDAGWPTLPSGMTQIQSSSEMLAHELTELAREVGAEDYLDLTFAQISQIVAALVADAAQMEILPERNAILVQMHQLGIENLVEDLRAHNVHGERIDAEFELALTSSVFEQLLRKSKLLAALGPRDLAALLTKFRQLDVAHVNSLPTPVRIASINNMRSYARAHREDTIRLDQMLAKYGIGMLRDMIATYPRLVQLARPIWIVPPIIAVEYIPQMHWVDLVICDTTERTELAAIIPMLLRGRQMVIVGDRRRNEIVHAEAEFAQRRRGESAMKDPAAAQTPNAAEESDSPKELDVDTTHARVQTNHPATDSAQMYRRLQELGGTSAFAAFAEIFPMLELPTLRVEHDEISARALMAHGYEGVYEPIPSCARKQNAHLIQVDGRGVPSTIGDGAIESPTAEVEAVVDVIVNYALDRNPDSLAVITVSPLHARQIRKALQNAKSSSVILERFMAQNDAEPFVVVDISQAYGLRRDHVVFSAGFGKTVHGRVLHSFGQLQEPHGFLDLVDSLEVARKSLTVVSSLGVGEIDTSRVSTPGPKLLAQIIAEAGSNVDSAAQVSDSTENPLLADLGRRLRDSGFTVGYDYGFAGSRKLPLVVGMPNSHDSWELAVLIDDAAYISEESLRRRDRFFPAAVEASGWLVYQTFSTSLFIDPAGQAEAIAKKLLSVHAPENPAGLVPPILDGETWVEEPLHHADADTALMDTDAATPEAVRSESDLETALTEVPRERTARPEFTPGLQLSAYTDDQLDEVLAWIASDGVARSESELTNQLRAELGITRQGVQIDAVLGNVVRRSDFV